MGDAFGTRAALVEALRAAMPGRAPVPPPIDFAHDEAVLLATGPRSSTGYGVRVVSVTERGRHVVVTAREDTPTLADRVAARLTYPHRLIVFPHTAKSVRIRWQNRP